MVEFRRDCFSWPHRQPSEGWEPHRHHQQPPHRRAPGETTPQRWDSASFVPRGCGLSPGFPRCSRGAGRVLRHLCLISSNARACGTCSQVDGTRRGRELFPVPSPPGSCGRRDEILRAALSLLHPPLSHLRDGTILWPSCQSTVLLLPSAISPTHPPLIKPLALSRLIY